MSEIEYITLSDIDIERIETGFLPKAKRSVFLMSTALLGLCFILPFVPSRRSKPLVETMDYSNAVLFFVLIFGCIVFYAYRKSVRGLQADLKSARKCVFKTKVVRKIWNRNGQFELTLESLPKGLSRNKFVYTAAESHCFHEGDVVVLEYLERSAVLLREFSD